MAVNSLMCIFDKFIPIVLGEENFVVELADTDQKRIKGLMHRETIPNTYGMLFIFDEESTQGIWMKNTLIYLDIIYLNKHKQIVDMHLNVPPCKKEPCQSYLSKIPALYALELKGNSAKRLGLKIGDTIMFTIDKDE